MEIDFRLNFFSKKIYNNYITFYRKVDDGIMSKSKKLTHNWWVRRLNAHYFIHDIYKKNKISFKKNYDFYLTKIIVFLLNKQANKS